jgi:hypothetical protein
VIEPEGWAMTATEVMLTTAEDESRLSSFIQNFLSQNGYPFVMVHADGFGARKVMFEDADVGAKFGAMWRTLAGVA